MTSKQKQFTAAIERARPGTIAELEKIAYRAEIEAAKRRAETIFKVIRGDNR